MRRMNKYLLDNNPSTGLTGAAGAGARRRLDGGFLHFATKGPESFGFRTWDAFPPETPPGQSTHSQLL